MQQNTELDKPLVLSILLLVLFGPLAIDVYLPAFPAMAKAFSVDKVMIQDTMTWFMFSLGIGQLLAGPLADKYGRRPIALIGATIYFISAAFISITQSLDTLLLSRLFQGIGACACSVAGFAAVRDYFGANRSSLMFSYINALICFVMASAPILGNYLTYHFGWQSNFVFMLFYGLFAGVMVYFCFRETRPAKAQNEGMISTRHKTQFINISPYMEILKQPVFIYHVCLCMLSMSVILAYVSSAPTWLMMDLGLSTNEFTLWFALNAVINIIACIYTPKIISRMGIRSTLTLGISLLLISGVLLLILSQYRQAWAFMFPIFIASLGYAFVLASAAGKALAPFTYNAGTAAALLGLFQMSGSGLIVIILLRFELDAPLLLALISFMLIPSLFILKSKSARNWYSTT